jgi:hypothetical protein
MTQRPEKNQVSLTIRPIFHRQAAARVRADRKCRHVQSANKTLSTPMASKSAAKSAKRVVTAGPVDEVQK